MLDQTVTVILAGGAGSRLHPLTADRAKPAVPFGGKYRIIDFTLSNCLHSGLRRVLILTQYKSHSLQKHLRDGWSILNPELGEYITTVPPQMRTGDSWYQGTADAIFQNLYLIERSNAKWVVILAGDHVYRMDYAAMIRQHIETGAAVTVACMQVARSQASAFGVLSLEGQRVTRFEEKPQQPESLPGDPESSLVSMGIYVFSVEHLLAELRRDHDLSESHHDFGRDIIPAMIEDGNVYGYAFGGASGRVSPDRYWRDVGTIDAYYEANMDLLKPVPPLNLYQRDWTIRTYSGQHPPARTAPGSLGNEGIFINSIIASGAVIIGGRVNNSILFSSVLVDDDASVEGCLLLEGVHVGKQARLQRCIVDKGVRIPEGARIGFSAEEDAKRFTLSPKGVVVIPKGFRF